MRKEPCYGDGRHVKAPPDVTARTESLCPTDVSVRRSSSCRRLTKRHRHGGRSRIQLLVISLGGYLSIVFKLFCQGIASQGSARETETLRVFPAGRAEVDAIREAANRV